MRRRSSSGALEIPHGPQVRRSRAWRVVLGSGLLGLLGAAALLVRPAQVDAGKPDPNSNNYFKYVDEDGVTHITNRPRGKDGDWKLYKSIAANRTNLAEIARGPGSGTTNLALDSEKAHRYDAYIRGAARRYQLPESFVRAVIHTESRYNPHAVSRAGAMGLMQLMPGTAKFLGVAQPFDPRQNVYGGCKLLRLLANRFNGDMVLVAAGYNAGAGAVVKYNGVPPYVETRAYVKGVLRRYYAYERQAQLGGGELRRGPARNIAQ
jgi:hypothetical protein